VAEVLGFQALRSFEAGVRHWNFQYAKKADGWQTMVHRRSKRDLLQVIMSWKHD
jgi:hypothetical protein